MHLFPRDYVIWMREKVLDHSSNVRPNAGRTWFIICIIKVMSKTTSFAVLSVDVHEDKIHPDQKSIQALKKWLKVSGTTLEVVYVLNCNDMGVGYDSATIAHQRLNQYVNDLKLDTPAHTDVLTENSHSNEAKAKRVIELANKLSAKMIILTSHGKSRITSFVLGSFAEAMLSFSNLPLFFLPPKDSMLSSELNTVLFATDLSRNSWESFNKFLEEFQDNPPKIILFHVIPSRPLVFELTEPRLNEIKEGERWAEHGRARGFEIVFVAKEADKNKSDMIIETAMENVAGMIAITCSSHRVKTKLLGNVATKIFKNRHFPLWVCGPGTLTLQKKINPYTETEVNKILTGGISDFWE